MKIYKDNKKKKTNDGGFFNVLFVQKYRKN